MHPLRFDLPRETVFRADAVELAVDAAEHPMIAGNSNAIAANWARERAANPHLFNGRVALLSRLAFSDDVLHGRAHEVDYAAFLYWRSLRPHPEAEHIYAHAMPVTSDNALVAVRMSDGTVNAGQVYFAAGSFEPDDFAGGWIDVEGNMAREVAEETGLSLKGLRHDANFQVYSIPSGTVLFRRYYFECTADDLAARIRDFASAGGDPDGEIVGPVVIRDAGDLPDRLAPQMPALIDWHFATPSLVA